MVGEHREAGQHEAAVQRADGQHDPEGGGAAPLLEQLVEALELALVIAKDQGQAAGYGRCEAGKIAVDLRPQERRR